MDDDEKQKRLAAMMDNAKYVLFTLYLTPRSDQGRVSPYNINTVSSI